MTLRFDRTVVPASVHRLHAGTVFLADVQPDGDGGYRAAAILPAGHEHYAAHTAEANRRLDPMLLLEACRQAHLYLAHAFYDVPADAHFIVNSLALRIPPNAYLRVPETGPGELTMTTPAPAAHQAGRRIRGLVTPFALALGGAPVGTVEIAMGYASPAAYQALRRRGRIAPPPWSADLPAPDLTGQVAPATVGRTSTADVLLADLRPDGPDGTSARLIVPVGHLALFDHPLDHVPGSLLVEAARQLGAVLSGDPAAAVMTSMHARFHVYTELDAPVRLVARAGEAVVTACQNDIEVATVAVGTAIPALSLDPARFATVR